MPLINSTITIYPYFITPQIVSISSISSLSIGIFSISATLCSIGFSCCSINFFDLFIFELVIVGLFCPASLFYTIAGWLVVGLGGLYL